MTRSAFLINSDDMVNQDIKQTNEQPCSYSYWQLRIMCSIMLGYACFYLLRQNFTVAMPFIETELGYSKIQIGSIISTAAVIYGLGKGISGMISDRCNARYFMTFGLFMSAIMNLCAGFSSGLTMLMFCWSMNSVFQSMGWPPCARLLTHWFSPKEIATKWALWNTSQQIGGFVVLIAAPFLIKFLGWRSVFYAPGVMCLFLSIFLFSRLRDTPESLGLPSVEKFNNLPNQKHVDADSEMPFKTLLWEKIFKNKLVWYVCFANFFLYIVRMSIFYWAPTFLREFKNGSLYMASWQSALFDLAGMFGGIVAGYLSDKVFNSHRGPVGTIFMVAAACCVVFLWKSPSDAAFLHFIGMALVGFLISGPQILVGVAATDFSSKRAAGAASGMTGVFGYIGTAITGVGVGTLVEYSGWDSVFLMITISAIMGAFFFALTWNHRAKVLDDNLLDD